MLNIKSLDEFRSNVSMKEEIRESNIGPDSISFCYMISGQDTFDSAWLRECRGITFDKISGRVSGRPLTKFFNVNERESTQVKNLDWSKVVRVMDKRDGSMLHTVLTSAGVKLKSKKSFTSDVAIAAQKLFDSKENMKMFGEWSKVHNTTLIFEYTAPDARIVLCYPEAELKLLHIRDNESGEYWSGDEVASIAAVFCVHTVDEVNEFFWRMGGDGLPFTQEFDIEKMLEAAKTREDIEGWVIQFEDGEMVKLKTEWYMKLHHAMVFVRERDIARLVLSESLDDVKAQLVNGGVDINEILVIEQRVLHDIHSLYKQVDAVVASDKLMGRKEFAMKHNGHELFGLIMKAYSGAEPDYKGYFEKNMLKENYGLNQIIYSPSIAEGEE